MGNKDIIKLTENQILALQSSDRDIETGRLVCQEYLDKNDMEWLNEELKTELDKRLNEYQNGIGRTYTWGETVAIIDQALTDRKNSSKPTK